MSDKALREQVLAEFIEYSDHHNNEAGHHNAIYGSEKIMQLIKEDRERVVKEARIDELKNIVSPARTNKQKHLGVAYLVEDRLAELSNPTQAKEKQ